MKIYLDYAWFGGDEYYKVFCMECRYGDFELFRIKTNSNEYMLKNGKRI